MNGGGDKDEREEAGRRSSFALPFIHRHSLPLISSLSSPLPALSPDRDHLY
jgi:hypothetical protein